MQRNKNGIPILPPHKNTRPVPFDLGKAYDPRKQCWGKTKHRNRASALGHRDAAGLEFGIYYCPWCFNWHVGHNDETLVLSVKVVKP
jgi:hypothetical protein